jgi:hypothetical protein
LRPLRIGYAATSTDTCNGPVPMRLSCEIPVTVENAQVAPDPLPEKTHRWTTAASYLTAWHALQHSNRQYIARSLPPLAITGTQNHHKSKLGRVEPSKAEKQRVRWHCQSYYILISNHATTTLLLVGPLTSACPYQQCASPCCSPHPPLSPQHCFNRIRRQTVAFPLRCEARCSFLWRA